MLEKVLFFIKQNKLIISAVSLTLCLAIVITVVGVSKGNKKNDDMSSVPSSSKEVISSEEPVSSEEIVSSQEPVVSEPEPESSSQEVSSTEPVAPKPTPAPTVPNDESAVDASYKSTLHPNLENNPFFDALVYTGYNMDKHRADGLMWEYVLADAKPAKGWLSGIQYGGLCNGYETNEQGLPNIELYKQKKESLVCATYVTYVYFNYLPNVAKVDVSALTKPQDSFSAQSWYVAARNWVESGQSQYVNYQAVDRGTKADIKLTADIPIGSIVCFQNYNNRNGRCSHIAVYAGYAKGQHWVFHVGNDNGPEFCTIEHMNRGPDPQWPLAIISTPNFIREAYGI